MPVSGSAMVGLFYSLVFALAMGTAWHLPPQATLFPLAAGTAGLILSLYQVVRELKGRAPGSDDDIEATWICSRNTPSRTHWWPGGPCGCCPGSWDFIC